ncbi:MAG: protease modulator HflC [Hoeflea sp.]|uniref:protease modulator HflC n=1 Tax=Hoeflea sp. TaxID=1940281 RepID=UPI001D30CEB1|nr:protease modulator HflC [Hoeflea sp.]MBU4527937.1 protease modulator HflC [Alphaproteobacteria bacterium]MBU4546028.1 protease modulator HflC [Alphaproteobacteria bacterium]MBU4553287.1 protease modulator HflC [Alphaproteobacteria bacterium]MBV1724361.1 protease modulator HflC [Hoeflea sp.]MBV1763357.1 protease modulator HflC [Hoeflea sp.]
MANRLPIIVGLLAVIAFLLWSSIFVVNEREQAIVVRFGQIQDVKTEPGLYFKLPFGFVDADRVQYVEDRVLRFDLDDIRVQVSGGKFYEVDAFVLYKIADARRFRQTVSGDQVAAESRLRTRLNSALRTVYGLRGFESALSEERTSMMREVRDQLRPEAESLGLRIDDVRIRRTDLTQEVSQQTFERMKAERLAEAELIRARGNEAAQRIRAIADRQVVEIVSEAARDSEIIRGEGDGERNRIFAEAFSRDSEFFEFYRSMNAYGQALADTGTTMVLSPTSEFFRYFNSAAGANPSAPVPASAPGAEEAAPAAEPAVPAN